MRELLNELIAENGGLTPAGPVLPFGECYGSLRKSCKDLNIPRLTHHTFRGWFARRAIEKAWMSRLLPHGADTLINGVLLLKRYRVRLEILVLRRGIEHLFRPSKHALDGVYSCGANSFQIFKSPISIPRLCR